MARAAMLRSSSPASLLETSVLLVLYYLVEVNTRSVLLLRETFAMLLGTQNGVIGRRPRESVAGA